MPSTQPSKSKGSVTARSRFEEAWELGLKNAAWVVPVIGAVLVFLLYTWGLLSQAFVGTLVALTLTLGPLAIAIPHATSHAKSTRAKYSVYALALLWLVGLGFPIYHTVFPPKPLGGEQLLTKGTQAVVEVGRQRRLELVARADLGGKMGSMSYTVLVETPGVAKEKVTGQLQREFHSVRVRRAMKQALSEHSVNIHQLSHSFGPQVTVRLDDIDESLAKQLHVALRPAGLPMWLFLGLAGLVVLAAMGLDLWFEREKAHTHLFVSAVFGAVFAYTYPGNASDNMVRGAIGSGIEAILWAALGGFFVIWLARTIFVGKKRKLRRRA